VVVVVAVEEPLPVVAVEALVAAVEALVPVVVVLETVEDEVEYSFI
jgi:hypothetical protein